ncbi:MAG: hypothetical protein HDR27_06085 [Lachnospiraceae bacterium]|nr:hypothetical protein [Lachnospiraceae bacterium]
MNHYESLLQDVDNKRKHCESVSCVGLLYEQGLGVTQDIRMAKQYFGEVLHRGCREAALKL